MFEDRASAGQKLAKRLGELKLDDAVIIALPRGGVPVGFEVANYLGAPLAVLVVRKLGVPHFPEFGFGAIASDGTKVIDQQVIDQMNLSGKEIKDILVFEQEEIRRRMKLYQSDISIDARDRNIILVDDGLATGVSMRAAVKAILKQNPRRLVVAIPVCSVDAVAGLVKDLRKQDSVVCLASPLDFSAVGLWYRHFPPVSDNEVISLLNRSLVS